MVRANTTITIDIVGQTGGWLPIDDTALRAGVLNALTPFFDVLSFTITRGSLISNVLDFQWFHWNYGAVLVIKTRVDHNDPDDIRSIVAGVFYDQGGAMPTVTLRTFGETQGPGVSQTGLGLLDLLTGSTVLLVVGAALLVYVVAYGPNVAPIARAVRP